MQVVFLSATMIITAVFLALGLFVFYSSYLRCLEAAVDLGGSVCIYFGELFAIPYSFSASVKDPSRVFGWADYLPKNFGEMKENTANYFALLFSGDNFTAWGKSVGAFLGNAAKVLIIVLPVAVILYFVIRWLYRRGNRRHNHDTVALRVFKWLAAHTYQPIKEYIQEYRRFLSAHGWVWKCWVALWAFHLNLASIVVAFFAFYFYFVIMFDFEMIVPQLGKLLIDLNVILKYFPWWTLLFLALWLFNRWRRKVALNKLRHMEARNCGFINELPIVSITCGSMGKRKTTAITDMALSQAVMFRQKALSILQENDKAVPVAMNMLPRKLARFFDFIIVILFCK